MIVGEGDTIVDGKTQFKDFISVYIADHKDAFSLAMSILRQIEAQQFKDKKQPVQFNITGTLKDEDA